LREFVHHPAQAVTCRGLIIYDQYAQHSGMLIHFNCTSGKLNTA